MCFPSHNSSQGKQFNLAEFSKNLWSICCVVIVYTNIRCFLPSRDLGSRVAVAVRHWQTYHFNVTWQICSWGHSEGLMEGEKGALAQAGNGRGTGVVGRIRQLFQEEMTPELSLEAGVAKWRRKEVDMVKRKRKENQEWGQRGEKQNGVCEQLQVVHYNRWVKYDVWRDK